MGKCTMYNVQNVQKNNSRFIATITLPLIKISIDKTPKTYFVILILNFIVIIITNNITIIVRKKVRLLGGFFVVFDCSLLVTSFDSFCVVADVCDVI